jgi:peptide deformylase
MTEEYWHHLRNKILLLGDPRLHEVSALVERVELPRMQEVVGELHEILTAYKARYGKFRAIAAPQIGVMKRLIYMCIEEPVVILNPVMTDRSEEMMELWDDCLCFPELLVRVRRHRSLRLTFRDLDWQENSVVFEGDLSELLQHEYDHLDGILATQRAIDGTSFCWRRPGGYAL